VLFGATKKAGVIDTGFAETHSNLQYIEFITKLPQLPKNYHHYKKKKSITTSPIIPVSSSDAMIKV